MRESYVCTECGHEYEELGDGKCYICGGDILPIDEIGQEQPEYPEDLLEENDEDEIPFEEEMKE
uniref:Uncharacterized protein n=1 Tax=candidate division CPR3 bacterium TaxID=2268181 RepID=A0A7V3N5R5_UNCC3